MLKHASHCGNARELGWMVPLSRVKRYPRHADQKSKWIAAIFLLRVLVDKSGGRKYRCNVESLQRCLVDRTFLVNEHYFFIESNKTMKWISVFLWGWYMFIQIERMSVESTIERWFAESNPVCEKLSHALRRTITRAHWISGRFLWLWIFELKCVLVLQRPLRCFSELRCWISSSRRTHSSQTHESCKSNPRTWSNDSSHLESKTNLHRMSR